MITAQEQTQMGLIEVEIRTATGDHVAQINDISDISYSFNLSESSANEESIVALYNTIKIQIMKYAVDGTDLYQHLISNVVDNETIVAVYIHTHIPREWPFFFTVAKRSVLLDDIARTVTIDCRPLLKEDITAEDVWNDGSLPIYRRSDIGATAKDYPAIGLRDFVYTAMQKTMNPSTEPLDAIIHSGQPGYTPFGSVHTPPENFTSLNDATGANRIAECIFCTLSTAIFSGVPEGLFQRGFGKIYMTSSTVVIGDRTKFTDQIQVNDVLYDFNGTIIGYVDNIVDDFELNLKSASAIAIPSPIDFLFDRTVETKNVRVWPMMVDLASLEGGYFGTGFGKNFYVNRSSDSQTEMVTLGINDITSLKTAGKYDFLQFISVAQLVFGIQENFIDSSSPNRRMPRMTQASAFEQFDEKYSQTFISQSRTLFPFLNNAQRVTSGEFSGFLWDGDYAPVLPKQEPVQGLVNAGLKAYKQIFTGEGIWADIEFMPAALVKPWMSIRFDQTMPESYQGKLFRLASISYNILNNTASARIYQIAGVSL